MLCHRIAEQVFRPVLLNFDAISHHIAVAAKYSVHRFPAFSRNMRYEKKNFFDVPSFAMFSLAVIVVIVVMVVILCATILCI